MKVLVTGGTGFVGQHLVPSLCEEYEVICLSRTTQSNYTETVNIDIADETAVKQLPDDIDYIVHLAAFVPDNQSSASRKQCDAVNSRGTMNLLEFAIDADVDRFVYVSSCHYLQSTVDDGDVEYYVDPDDVYEVSKYGGEVLSGVYRDAYNLNVVTLRAAYIYGPGMPQETVLYTFLERAVTCDEITLYNGGTDSTDFLYVEDLVRAIKCALAGTTGDFVIGSGKRTSMRALVDAILDVTGTNDTVEVEVEAQTREPTDFYVHDDDVAGQLGYRPTYDIREGIRALLAESPLQGQTEGPQ